MSQWDPLIFDSRQNAANNATESVYYAIENMIYGWIIPAVFSGIYKEGQNLAHYLMSPNRLPLPPLSTGGQLIPNPVPIGALLPPTIIVPSLPHGGYLCSSSMIQPVQEEKTVASFFTKEGKSLLWRIGHFGLFKAVSHFFQEQIFRSVGDYLKPIGKDFLRPILEKYLPDDGDISLRWFVLDGKNLISSVLGIPFYPTRGVLRWIGRQFSGLPLIGGLFPNKPTAIELLGEDAYKLGEKVAEGIEPWINAFKNIDNMFKKMINFAMDRPVLWTVASKVKETTGIPAPLTYMVELGAIAAGSYLGITFGYKKALEHGLQHRMLNVASRVANRLPLVGGYFPAPSQSSIIPIWTP